MIAALGVVDVVLTVVVVIAASVVVEVSDSSTSGATRS